MAITSLESTSERKNSVAVAAVKAAHSTQIASLQATLLFTEALLLSPLFATRFIVRAAAALAGLVERQVEPCKELAPNASLVTIADDAARAAQQTIDAPVQGVARGVDAAAQGVVEEVDAAARGVVRVADDVAQGLATGADGAVLGIARGVDDAAQGVATGVDDAGQGVARGVDDAAQGPAQGIDDAAQAVNVTTAGDVTDLFAPTTDDVARAVAHETMEAAAPEYPTKTDNDQEIQLRAERLVVNKQLVPYGETRVLKEIVTEIKSIDVPVSHDELVIDRQAIEGNGDVDDAAEPISADSIRIPLTKEKVSVSKETVVREEVELGKRRGDEVEHIGDTLRHEELRADCATTNPATPGANIEQLVPADNTLPALVTMLGPTTASAEIEQATLHERIQNRAYALWEGEGRSEGRQLDHWAQAEREIFAMLTPSMDLRSVLRHAA